MHRITIHNANNIVMQRVVKLLIEDLDKKGYDSFSITPEYDDPRYD